MQRYIIENRGPDKGNVAFMLKEAMRICQLEGMSKITLFVPSKGSFQDTVVGQLLGGATKKLCKGEVFHLTENISLDLQSANKVSSDRHYEMIVGVYLSLGALLELESSILAKAIIFLPWMEEEGKRWLSMRNATIMGAHTWQVRQTSLPPEVNNALLALAQGINRSTGLAHPSDRNAARRALIELRDFGHVLSPNDVRVWALQNGWRPDAAKDIAGEVESIFKSN